MSVRVTTLPSGLRVATERLDGVETAALGLYVGVGTRHETAEVNGAAHLLEHMVFKGTPRRDARAIAEEIEAVGGHMNAYTGREQTAFYARVLADDIPLAIDLVSDITLNATIDPEELARERAVVLQEIGQANDTPDDVIFDHFQECAFPDQAMGRPTLGRAEIVAAMPREALTGFVDRHYAPARMVFSTAGKVDHDQVVDLVGRAFAALDARAEGPAEPSRYRGGERREERDLDQVHVVLGFESCGVLDPDHHAMAVFSTLLGGGMSSRLFQEVREKRGLVYSIYSFHSPFIDGGIFGIYAGTGEDEVAEMMPVICDQLSAVAHDLKPEELQRAKAQMRAGLLMSRESTSSRSEQLAGHLLVLNRPWPVAEQLAAIEAVTEADIRRCARRLLASAPTLVGLGPVDKLEPLERLRTRLG
ncbi:MAG: pitrilysin family protein [Thalassobaculales bacterium]